MNNGSKITLTAQDLEKAKEFATIKAPSTPSPIKRNEDKKVNDIIEGKLGEIALAKFLHDGGIYVEPDFQHYQSGEDDMDFTWGSVVIDCKTIPHYSQWLLVASDPFDRGKRCHFYPLVRISKDGAYADVLGYAIVHDIEKAERGRYINGLSTKLDMTNYAIHYTKLRHPHLLAEHIDTWSLELR